MIDHHSALVYTMVLVSAADGDMTDAELAEIGESVRHLPIFRDFDRQRITETAAACADMLTTEDGLDKAIALLRDALPARLRETAYALACDVAAADGKVTQEESRLLEILRHRLDVDRLIAAAIERGAQARHATA
ncbi:MAG: tellurite resistance TerB family protein [Alphaproteobacteria bacterium]|nr:tellurite resistance TerB family protein [Alphaproteobacteria bacterium]